MKLSQLSALVLSCGDTSNFHPIPSYTIPADLLNVLFNHAYLINEPINRYDDDDDDVRYVKTAFSKGGPVAVSVRGKMIAAESSPVKSFIETDYFKV